MSSKSNGFGYFAVLERIPKMSMHELNQLHLNAVRLMENDWSRQVDAQTVIDYIEKEISRRNEIELKRRKSISLYEGIVSAFVAIPANYIEKKIISILLNYEIQINEQIKFEMQKINIHDWLVACNEIFRLRRSFLPPPPSMPKDVMGNSNLDPFWVGLVAQYDPDSDKFQFRQEARKAFSDLKLKQLL